MLTESERQWAVNAKMRLSHKDCFRCGKCGVQCYFLYVPCPLIVRKEDKDWEIEFQSRVAAKLAAVFREIAHVFGGNNTPLPCKYCPANACCKLSDDCDDGILKWAYIAVEEEMDGKA